MLDLDDVGAGVADHRRQHRQPARRVLGVDEEAHQPPLPAEAAEDRPRRGAEARRSPRHDEHHGATAEPCRVVEQQRQRRRAGALGHRLLQLEQVRDRRLDRRLVHGDHVVGQRADQRDVSTPGSVTAMPSAIVAVSRTGDADPEWKRSVIAGNSSLCTPTSSASRASGLAGTQATATPARSPPPPTGTITASHCGTAGHDLDADRPLTRDHEWVVVGMHEHPSVAIGDPAR